VGGGIVFPEVSLDLDDAGGETGIAFAYQDFAEKVAGDAAGIAGVEGAGEWMYGCRRHGIRIRMQRLGGESQNEGRLKPRLNLFGFMARLEAAPLQSRMT